MERLTDEKRLKRQRRPWTIYEGQPGGLGNPFAAQVGKLRASMFGAVTEAYMKAIVSRLVEQAKSGDIPAARVLFSRGFGHPLEADVLERIEELENQARKKQCDVDTAKG